MGFKERAKIESYKEIARQARINVLKLLHKAQTSHIGSCYSSVELLSVLFEKMDFDGTLKKDIFIASKGWIAALVYYFLAQKKLLDWKEVYEKYCDGTSPYIGLLEPTVPGIHAAGGSVGYGLSFGTGYALGKKLEGEKGKIYVLLSDGELDCGMNYEAATIAAHHKLDNLVAMIDANSFQATGKKEEILEVEPIRDRWQSWHWDVREINGHNFEEIEKALTVPHGSPLCIIARTIKGKGVSFMESKLLYHYKNVSDEEYQKAMIELCI